MELLELFQPIARPHSYLEKSCTLQTIWYRNRNQKCVKEQRSCKIYRVSQEECAKLQEGVPYVKVYRYNPKHLCPKSNGYGDNGQRGLKL